MRWLRLPFTFEPERLRHDLAHVAATEWIPHQQRGHYDGEWSGVALRAPVSETGNITADSLNGQGFADTPLLARCPYFQDVLGAFRCPLRSVRLLRLHAGSTIAEHIDRALEFEDGEVRIHIPIVTSEAVRFYLDGVRLAMAPGECWYTNVNLPHSVENGGATDRIHLVLDCTVDDWLRELFASTPPPPRDYYAATLSLDLPPEVSALIRPFQQLAATRAAGAGPKFQIQASTFVLQWNDPRAWQIRLRLPRTLTPGDIWSAEIETSPDPEARHLGDYRALRQRLLAELPALRFAGESP